MKLVKTGAVPISCDTGLNEIQEMAESGKFDFPKRLGKTGWRYSKSEYIEHLLEYVNPSRLKPLKIVVNAGNGAAGPVLDLLEKHLPFEFIKLHHKPDGHFPNGIPNPLLIENRKSTSEAVIKHKADLGLAWDGDFDRCFFFDEQGAFISGYYMVGLLAVYQLAQGPNSTILHDPRLTWNSIDLIESAGGKAKESRTGHAFFKEKMRSENAIYGGEISAHHYFKKFAYADSGMIPWLLISQMLSANGKTMSSLISERKKLFPSSDELNFKVKNPDYLIKAITDHYKDDVVQTNQTDGYGLEFKRWRFNLRQSNTEPLIRLNIETREDLNLLNEKISELSKLIQELDVA
jgi:phosphomannomutase